MNEPLSLDDHLPDNLRIPPHSQEAEQAVLGGLLLNNEAWDEVAERVGPKDFYRKEHRLIFQVVDQLVEEEKPCDLVTVSQALTHRGELDDVGGMTYLSDLARNTPSAANINAYPDMKNNLDTSKGHEIANFSDHFAALMVQNAYKARKARRPAAAARRRRHNMRLLPRGRHAREPGRVRGPPFV